MGGIFHLRLLGPIQVERDGEPVYGFRSRKALALLAYLAVQGQPVPREHLADLFWEDKTQSRGRANLSWTLNKILTQLPGCLEADRHTLQFKRGGAYRLDVDIFEELEGRGDATSLAAAVALCRGQFLEGLCLAGCAEFEIWLVRERERWCRRVAQALGQLVTHHSQRGEYQQGLRFAQRLLTMEPWREETHRQVMRLLAYNGQRAAALAQCETCRRVLAEALDVELGTETTRLYEQIRDEALEIPVSPSDRLPDLPPPPPPFLEEEEPIKRPIFVARQRELARLEGFLDGALAGQGRVVFVTGDAGQGKTALIQEFARRAQVAHPDLVVAGGSGNAHTGIGDPYLPFREMLDLLTGDVEARWAAGAMTKGQACCLWHTLPLAVQALVEVGPNLIDLLVPGAALVKRAAAFRPWPGRTDWLPRLEELVERKGAISSDPSLQQSALFEQYTRVLRWLAGQRPLLLVLDDLQWVDSGSISLLFHLGRRIEGSRILVVGAYRPAEVAQGRPPTPSAVTGGKERHPLESVVNELKRHFGDIEVDLSQAEDRGFVDAFLDTEPNRLGEAFRRTLYQQTRGHPLFTLELLRGMQERGDLVQDSEGRWVEGPALDWDRLPARVEAVIAERIGRLPERLQAALIVASVEGETFTAEVVARVRGADEEQMVQRLSGKLDREHRLVSAQGIRWIGDQCLSLYRFRHILFQRYLYNSLDRVERAHLHRAVGAALEALYGEGAGEITAVAPLRLARHFQEAGIAEKAVDYLRQAGERAVRLSAHEEAIPHFSRGLELLETLPDSPGRTGQELRLQLALGVSLQATRGYAAPEVGRAFGRARELCRQVGETPQIFPALRLLGIFYGSRGEYQTAQEIAEQLLYLAERAEDPLLVAIAHLSLGWNLLFLGEFSQAKAHLERVIAFYEQHQRHVLAFTYGFDHGVACLSFASWVLWALGYLEQALKRNQEALTLAHDLSHPLSLAFAQSFAGIFHAFRRDVSLAQESAEACICLSTRHGFPYWLASGVFLHGWTLAEQGQTKEGMAQIRQGIADYQATGAEMGRSHQLASLAEACGKTGQIEEGLAALADALATVKRTGERFFEAEIHRLKGELLLKAESAGMRDESGDSAAEACFLKAIEVARRQGARLWELRAMISLCRLWRSRGAGGKRKEARQQLGEIYGWFTEGFDTPDLKEARALLGG